MTGLTIVIPSINRDTLARSIQSVENQYIEVPYLVEYDLDRTSAGATKTKGVQRASSEWIGFLDDDDTLAPFYSYWWNQNKDDCDVMLFKCFNVVLDKVVPEPGYDSPKTLTKSHIGMSLAIKRDVFLEHPMWNEKEQGAPEDWELIRWLKDETNYKIKVVDQVAYYIWQHGGLK